MSSESTSISQRSLGLPSDSTSLARTFPTRPATYAGRRINTLSPILGAMALLNYNFQKGTEYTVKTDVFITLC